MNKMFRESFGIKQICSNIVGKLVWVARIKNMRIYFGISGTLLQVTKNTGKKLMSPIPLYYGYIDYVIREGVSIRQVVDMGIACILMSGI